MGAADRTTPIRASWLDPLTLPTAEIVRWADLAGAAAEANPFFEPAYVLPAFRHLSPERAELLVVEDDQTWLAALPVHQSSRRRLRTPATEPWMHDYCYLGTPLVRAGREDVAAHALVDAMRMRGALVAFPLLSEGPVAAAIERAAGDHGLRPSERVSFERAALVRRPQDDYVESVVRSRRRSELRRKRKLLARELGSALELVDRSGEPEAVETFLTLEAAGWKGRAGTALALRDAEFFRELCTGFASDGRLELLSLEASGRPVAMSCNVRAQRWSFCLKMAYDERWRRHSPGVQLILDVVHAFHDRRAADRVDSCTDSESTMVKCLWPDRRSLTTHVFSRRGLSGTLAHAEARATDVVRQLVRGRAGATPDVAA